MLNKILKKLLNFYRVLIIKCFNFNSFFYRKGILSVNLASSKCIQIKKGKIVCNGYITIPKTSILSVNDGGNIEIGKNCFINNNVICVAHNDIRIGDNVSIGPNCCLYDHDHDFDENGQIHGKYKKGNIKIGDNVWLGAGVIILRNTIIGDNCIIGAGTVVKGKIPNNSLVTSGRNLKIIPLKKTNKGDKK